MSAYGGGYNGYQAIKQLEKKERKYRLSVDIKTGEAEWEKLQIEDENFIFDTATPIFRVTSSMGKMMIAPYHSRFEFEKYLIDVMDETGPYDCVVELGCGYGRNLINMFYNGGDTNLKYYGGEFTQSGVDIATKLAAATPNMKAEFFHFNHLSPNLDIVKNKNYECVFVFTSHSIEQVNQIHDNWFKVVASIAPHVRCVHLEPFGFQSKILGEVSEKHKAFIQQNKWNENFTQVLQNAVNNGDIVVDGTMLEIGFSDDVFNPGSLCIWHSNGA
ncbi:hypothetical protein [Campylobacter majalis]|nr:hypothetical protein [Campylobacter majalis]